MAMTMKTEGLEELSNIFAQLEDKAYDVAAESLYEGAGVVANAFKGAISSIRTEPFKGKKDSRLPSPEEKKALQGKSSIANFIRNGEGVDTLIGISGSAGYADIGGKKKAVRLIARSINSGTSFMNAQPVFRKAVNTSKAKAQAAIVSKAEEKFNEIIK